jgi:hypothetical protein
MLVVETIARIRREHFVKGKTIKEIARDLGVSRNTARRVLRSGETSFESERTVQLRPKLGRCTAALDALLEGNATKPAREQLTLIRIYEELRGRGYDGGYDAVRRYAGRWAKDRGHATAAAYVPFKSYDELNAWLTDKCIAYTKAHLHPELTGQTIWEVFEAERLKLVPYAGLECVKAPTPARMADSGEQGNGGGS